MNRFLDFITPAVSRHCGFLAGGYVGRDELTQEALCRIWRSIPGLRSPEKVNSWMYQIIKGALTSELKKSIPEERRLRNAEDVHLRETGEVLAITDRLRALSLVETPVPILIVRELYLYYDEQQPSQEACDLLLMRLVEGHSFPEMAESTGLRLENVKIRTRRALSDFRAWIANKYDRQTGRPIAGVIVMQKTDDQQLLSAPMSLESALQYLEDRMEDPPLAGEGAISTLSEPEIQQLLLSVSERILQEASTSLLGTRRWLWASNIANGLLLVGLTAALTGDWREAASPAASVQTIPAPLPTQPAAITPADLTPIDTPETIPEATSPLPAPAIAIPPAPRAPAELQEAELEFVWGEPLQVHAGYFARLSLSEAEVSLEEAEVEVGYESNKGISFSVVGGEAFIQCSSGYPAAERHRLSAGDSVFCEGPVQLLERALALKGSLPQDPLLREEVLIEIQRITRLGQQLKPSNPSRNLEMTQASLGILETWAGEQQQRD